MYRNSLLRFARLRSVRDAIAITESPSLTPERDRIEGVDRRLCDVELKGKRTAERDEGCGHEK